MVSVAAALALVALVGFLAFLVKIRAPPPDPAATLGPAWFPFLGSTMELFTNQPKVQSMILHYQLLYKGRNFSFRTLKLGVFNAGYAFVACTEESVRHVLKTNFGNYVKGPKLKGVLSDFLGDGIFTSDGERWKKHRKVAVRMFSKRLLQEGTEVALVQARKLVARVREHARTGEPFDLQRLFFAFTMDTFCYIAFGFDLDSQQHDHEFARCFDEVQGLSDARGFDPFYRVKRALGFLFASERAISRGVATMKEFAREVIARKRRTLAAGEALGPDLISRFMQEADKRGDPAPSDEELISIILNFILAGRDTTASALSWASQELINNPAEAIKVADELKGAMPPGATWEDLKKEDIFKIVYNGLPYTKAAVSETLRLHPSVGKDVKFAVKEDVWPDGTRVPPGSCVIYCPYSMGRDPLLWKDPLRFDPGRWLVSDDAGSVHRPTAVSDFLYPVFNAGPRVCLGRPLAYLEIQLMLARLCSQFVFEHAKPPSEEYRGSLVSAMKHGLVVTARRR